MTHPRWDTPFGTWSLSSGPRELVEHLAQLPWDPALWRREGLGLAEFHSHSSAGGSDGVFSPEECVSEAWRVFGLSALAITEHNTLESWERGTEYSRKEGLPIEVIPSVEWSCVEGHLLIYDILPDQVRQLPHWGPARETITRARRAAPDALIGPAHPYSGSAFVTRMLNRRGFTSLSGVLHVLTPDHLDGVNIWETFNSWGTVEENRRAVADKPAGVLGIEGSDSHSSIPSVLGVFNLRDGWRKALSTGRCAYVRRSLTPLDEWFRRRFYWAWALDWNINEKPIEGREQAEAFWPFSFAHRRTEAYRRSFYGAARERITRKLREHAPRGGPES